MLKHELLLDRSGDSGADTPRVLILPALGVAARKYASPGSALGERGFAGDIVDWPGTGCSAIRTTQSD